MTNATTLQYDNQTHFEGGQNMSMPPSELPENQYVKAVNVSTRKGVLTPRFGFERKKLKFPAGGYSYEFNKISDFEYNFHAGKFQALCPFVIGQRSYLVVVVSGIIYLIDQDTFNVSVLTLNTYSQVYDAAPRINWAVGGRFLVLYDFPSLPVILDGHVAYRSDRSIHQLPVANLGTFNQSRMFFANRGIGFSAGDPVGNDLTPDAPITVEEIEDSGSPYYGDVYAAPTKFNIPITAMATLQSVDTSTGIGALIAATNREIFAFDTTQARDKWTAGQFGTSLNDEAGIVGPRALCNVNSDLFFVSDDGQLRSLSASRDAQKKWARVPMSVQVADWVSYIDDALKPYTAICYFKNKIFWTVRPYRVFAQRLDTTPVLDVAHSGMVVLETDNIARFGVDAAPAWAGLWTGVHPMDMCVTPNERMFIMSKDSGGNFLYEVDPNLTVDKADTQVRRIRSTVYTREHLFGNHFSLKKLHNVELGISSLRGPVHITVEYKPNHSEKYHPFGDFRYNVPDSYTDISSGLIPEKLPLAFREIKFGRPDSDEAHPVTRDLFSCMKSVQLRVTLYADNWQFDTYQIGAEAFLENLTEFLPDDLPEATEEAEPYSDWTYEEFSL